MLVEGVDVEDDEDDDEVVRGSGRSFESFEKLNGFKIGEFEFEVCAGAGMGMLADDDSSEGDPSEGLLDEFGLSWSGETLIGVMLR